ncbi:MAG: hypothetical protein RLZ98_1511 [Pseudomonadota bacterium]|jgi:uncharacterized membrane protein YebE (DUF533 family)
MFDAKSLLEMIAKGAGGPQQPQAQGVKPLEDLLRQLTQGQQGGSGPGTPAANDAGLGDIFKNMFPGQQAQAPQAAPGGQPPGGGLGDILGQLQKNLGAGGQGQGGQGSITDILGQATSGVREGAQKVDDATGASDQLRRMVEQLSGGKNPEQLMQQIKELIANNQLGAGAALGGLGALIGGLAYKAYQNYSEGKPVLGGGAATNAFAQNPEAAPSGSGFEPEAVSNDTAALMIRAMLASAAADGRIDEAEQQKIIGSLQQGGSFDAEAEAFVQNELRSPASAADLAAHASSPEQAVQIFTAARIAVDVDTIEEQQFLYELSTHLNLDPTLVAHIDAEARAAG